MVENRESLWISVVASAAAGLLVLSGCSSDSTASSSNARDLVPAQYSQTGVLPVVMDIAYAPFGFFQGDDTTAAGFDVDLITGVAEVLGLQVEIQDMDHELILPLIAKSTNEIGVSAVTVTDERLRDVDFITYLGTSDLGLTLASDPGGLALDTSLCGKKAGAFGGSVQETKTIPELNEDCVKANLPEIVVSPKPGSDFQNSLRNGDIDIFISDSAYLVYTESQSEGEFQVTSGPTVNPAILGIAVAKDNDISPAIAMAIDQMIADGSYGDIVAKWNLESDALGSAEVLR